MTVACPPCLRIFHADLYAHLQSSVTMVSFFVNVYEIGRWRGVLFRGQ